MRPALLPAALRRRLSRRFVRTEIIRLCGVIERLNRRCRGFVSFDFLADDFGNGTQSVGVALKIRDVEKAGLLQSDFDERRLHARQHSRHFAFVDIAHQSPVGVALEVELGQRAVFEQSHPHFKRGGIDYDFTFHLEIVVRPLPAVFQTRMQTMRKFRRF